MAHPPPAPALPDGLVAVVKEDCPTCVLVAPVLADLADRAQLTAITQDNAAFPAAAPWVVHDHDLALSWHHDIETVPTLLTVENGTVTARLEGWKRDDWEAFTGIDGLGVDLPDWRPGCGSLSVDPTLTDELAVRFSGSAMTSRRIELAELEDEWEAMWDRGWSDGLPVVPPSEARVLRMLEGTSRGADEVVAVVPPDLVEVTVEKIAINAVMAGCRPEYLPVVIAAVEAICTDDFNMHGVLATTMDVGPVIIVNGPIRNEIGMNSGGNVLGQGNRANSTIGRAVQLVVRNVGGGKPGGVDRSAHGSPHKLGLAFAEDEEGSAWTSLAESRGFRPDQSTVTVWCGGGPQVFVDQISRTPESLTKHFAQFLKTNLTPKMVMMETVLVIGPEHMARYRDAGWDRDRFLTELDGHLQMDTDDLVRGADDIEEGLPEAMAGTTIGKFWPGGVHVVHAGGATGLFSMAFSGWVPPPKGSVCTTKEIIR
ncbi:MAG: thioredoxin [Actinomycetota bacterium]